MDEKRQYFRIKNNGDILANISTQALDIIDISASGAILINKNLHLDQQGSMEIKIHNFTMQIHYEILRSDKETLVIVFKQEEEINQLLIALKQLRDERKTIDELYSNKPL